jgi:hypothetical protein
MENIIELVKKYWYLLIIGVLIYPMFKAGKSFRKRYKMNRSYGGNRRSSFRMGRKMGRSRIKRMFRRK